MTLDEFRAWLSGFEESFSEDGPDTEQWEKVTKELAEVQAVPVITPSPQITPYPFPLSPPWSTTTGVEPKSILVDYTIPLD